MTNVIGVVVAPNVFQHLWCLNTGLITLVLFGCCSGLWCLIPQILVVVLSTISAVCPVNVSVITIVICE